MEWLMTYGWVILIVIIVAGALYFLGVLNPETYMPVQDRYPEQYQACLQLIDWFGGEYNQFYVYQNREYLCAFDISDCQKIGNQTLCFNTTMRYMGVI